MFDNAKIPMRRLDRSRAHDFDYRPSVEDLREIAVQNEWRKLDISKFSGTISPIDEGWAFEGRIIGLLTQNCVISGAPVKFDLDLPVERQYLTHMPDLPKDFTIEDDFDTNIEPIPQNLDLNALISEEVLLEAPDYPRLKEYDRKEIWESDPVDEDDLQEERKASPFADLDKRLSQKE